VSNEVFHANPVAEPGEPPKLFPLAGNRSNKRRNPSKVQNYTVIGSNVNRGMETPKSRALEVATSYFDSPSKYLKARKPLWTNSNGPSCASCLAAPSCSCGEVFGVLKLPSRSAANLQDNSVQHNSLSARNIHHVDAREDREGRFTATKA